MNNQIFSRLCSLMQGLGFTAQEEEITTAEMRAYAAGLSMIDELLEKAFRNSFIDTADEYGISMLLSLLELQSYETLQQDRENIIRRMSEGFELMQLGQILGSFFLLYYTFDANGEKYRFHISDLGYTRESFRNLRKLLDIVMPVYERIYSSGNYQTFAQLDSVGLRWHEIDEARLPFYAWNTIAGNNYD